MKTRDLPYRSQDGIGNRRPMRSGLPLLSQSRSARSKIAACLPLLLAALATPSFAATASTPGITPVQAELMADMNARLLKVGAPVYARVTVDWTGTDCVLRSGAVLEAH